MRIRTGAGVLLGLLAAIPVTAQQVPRALTLERAIEIARANNPTYLQTRNDQQLADWDVRQAYGQWLPSASGNSSVTWQGAGEQQFGTLTLGDLGFGDLPSYYLSSYGISLGLNVSLATLVGPSQAKAQRGATEARGRLADATLVSQVTAAYLEALRQRETLRLAEQQLENASFNLRLAQGRLEVGAATPIDVGQAEVQVGRAEVGVLQARNAVATARMRLLQQLGSDVEQEVELATTFPLGEPDWALDPLMDMALRRNPTLDAARRSRDAAELGVKAARSPYFPTLSVSTGWSGFTREASNTDLQVVEAQARVAGQVSNCVATNDLYSRLVKPLPPRDCTRFAFTYEQRQAILDQNDQFPFDFQRSPFSVRFGLSIPVFQGFSRQRNLEAAKLQREDLSHQLREQELSLHTDLAISLSTVRTAYESALLEARNRALAEQQLRLARERYQLGAITFVELVAAQTVLAQADRDETAATFAYHDAVTRLEALVGAPLR